MTSSRTRLMLAISLSFAFRCSWSRSRSCWASCSPLESCTRTLSSSLPTAPTLRSYSALSFDRAEMRPVILTTFSSASANCSSRACSSSSRAAARLAACVARALRCAMSSVCWCREVVASSSCCFISDALPLLWYWASSSSAWRRLTCCMNLSASWAFIRTSSCALSPRVFISAFSRRSLRTSSSRPRIRSGPSASKTSGTSSGFWPCISANCCFRDSKTSRWFTSVFRGGPSPSSVSGTSLSAEWRAGWTVAVGPVPPPKRASISDLSLARAVVLSRPPMGAE
mmetsp:Transcript_32871/g.97642  ORF Transcript_32871/g.97642 Transcript_32871/m.97642 type:complete len:284 (-) Transcript_32871:198-1049(-)